MILRTLWKYLHFPTMDLIENACPPKLMVEQVEHRYNEAKEKIKCLDHISIEYINRLIRQPLATKGNTTFLSAFGTSSLKRKMEYFKCDAQLGFE